MKLRALSLEELAWLHQTELTEAFPPSELKPYAAMEKLCQAGAYRPVGAFEGETLVGYALLWEDPDQRYVLVDYLGVTAARRNQGLGGEILRLLSQTFSNWDGIIIESEAPEGGPEDAIRRRRIEFYRRNGYTFLGYDCMLFGVHYKVCLHSPNGEGTEAGAMASHQALYRSQFTQWAYDRYIQIPRDPAKPLEPPESWAEQTTLPGMEE
ncbi:MAG: GNAT family N-acetyltransferase [Evtepia sp.]|uniref:GNAT family N-acetyltransferase n=1 Tax=Evtepia sp. TaxID=2773933 RepID=UPI002A761291|nr:GNAT family N-acetyltransferase [Evtepia sp.]MDY3013703.1 GNAT family N-acetyltransferase [Evtepia sp.]